MHLRRHGIGKHVSHRGLHLVFKGTGYHMILTRHERFEAGLCDLRRIILLAHPDFGILHARAVEKIGLCRAGHQSRYGHAGILQLVANGLRKGLDESLRRVVRSHHATAELA